MANLNFKYGASYENLPAAISNGTIYVTKNEKAMYVDLDDTRLRLGQIIVYDTWEGFNATETLPPQAPEAFYYIQDKNALLKYDETGNTWIQINSISDLQADLSELQAAVSALQTTTSAHGGRLDSLEAEDIQIKASITAETDRAKAAEQKNADAITGEINRAKTAEEGISSDVTALGTRVTNIENNYVKTTTYEAGIKDLQDQITSNDTDITNLKDSVASINTEIDDIDERVNTNTTNISGLSTTVNQHTSQISDLNTADSDLNTKIENEITRAKAAEKTNADNLTTEIERAQGEESRIESLITNLSTTVSQHTSKISTLENKVGSAATDGAAATGLFKAIADETTRATNKENELAQSITDNVNTLQGNIDDNSESISANANEITNIKNNYVTNTTYNAGIKNLQDQITSNDEDIATLQDNLTATNESLSTTAQQVETNKTDIAGLNTTVSTQGTKITALEQADTTIISDLNEEIGRAKAAEKANTDAIEAEADRAVAKEAVLEENISANATLINTNKTNIATNATNISNLTSYVGTIPENEGENVIEYIQNQFAAANAMTYKGGITDYASLPTTGVEAGFTYVVTEDFIYGNDSYYAGDLVVAAADQEGDTYTGGWTHVRTGYVASQENKLVTSGNGVQLQSYAGTNLGSMTIASEKVTTLVDGVETEVDQIKIATTTSGNATTVTLSMEWGTF